MGKCNKNKILLKFIKNRGFVQFFATILTNINILNIFKGKLYTGNMKKVCFPGLNCYSCPAASGACPIGSFQAVVGSAKYKFSYYITGILILIGTCFGRIVCGFLCPFGWFQDLIYNIPFKKFNTKKISFLRYIKYVVLIVTVWLLPTFVMNSVGMGEPYFCKYICPQGILEGGIPLSLVNSSIAAAVGILFKWKLAILVFVIVLSLMIYRPFCKWICPLGAFYSIFNKVSFFQYNLNVDKCISCGKCYKNCKMGVDITKNINSLECIRCGECVEGCPTNAISIKWGSKCEQTERKCLKNEK